ncbi:hypothetical protein IFR05_006260 [Cadophora sp. M221]|nr:hypothetical protein IFR05_006260 [Cadophora sp. M221]
MPLLLAVKNDNTVETISEDDLYKYTRHRWAINESSRLKERYLKFNLHALLEAAVAACSSSGARSSPKPVRWPSFYTTASEVATRTFLRDALSIPIPRIIAWSGNRSNAVGAEFIIEEKAVGEPLGNLWKSLDTLPMNDRMLIVDKILEIEKKLASMKFAQFGCLYFREDIPNSNPLQTNPPLSSQMLNRFTMGPLVSNEFWSGEKAVATPEQFIKAIAENERNFIKEYATPRMNYHHSLIKPKTPHEMLSMIDRYLQLTPAMVPAQFTKGVDIHSPTLWHPDLHPNNIFVDPETKYLSQVIDWQSALSLPLFYDYHMLTAIKHHGPALTVLDNPNSWPEPPENYHSLSPDEKTYIDNAIGSWIQSAWSNKKTFFLRRSLVCIANRWKELCPDADPCPWVFTEDELASYEHEKETRGYVSTFLAYFQDNWGVSMDGSIEVGRFTEVRAEMKLMRAHFVGSADDEEEKELAEKIWPHEV